ncbi:MAG: PilW family protein [Vicinamibacterales bacterium]
MDAGAAMTLPELMVAACVTTLVAGAALTAVTPLQQGFARQPEAASLAQRTRVVAEFLSSDLRRAALVLPIRVGDVGNDIARGVFYRSDVLSTVADPVEALARGLIAPANIRTYHLKQDSEGVWQLMQYDGRASDQPAVEDVVSLRVEYFGDAEPPAATVSERGAVRVTYGAVPPPLDVDDPEDSWGAGENCTIANAGGQYAPRLAAIGPPGISPLSQAVLADGPWCPDAFHAFRFDADLLRVRRVRVQVRLQASRPFRGLAGLLFTNSGSAGGPWRSVPDETITLDIAPRNINVAR